MKKRTKTTLIVLGIILAVIIVVNATIAIITTVAANALQVSVGNVEKVEYVEETIKPQLDEKTGKAKLDENGNYNFIDTSDILSKRNFRVLQLTDIHLGAGAFSMNNDGWTIKTVEDIIRRQKPDLVVVTGDIVYPVMFQSGTMNNMKSSKIFATLMESLGVYWTAVFGNHDSEIYSYYDRQEIGDLYMSNDYPHCLFNANKRHLKDGSEVFGVGNYAINIKDKNNELVHTMFLIDSNAYLPDDPVGILWHYDKIHDDQLKWYEEMSDTLKIKEKGLKSTVYFHIPTTDMVEIVDAHKGVDTNNIRLMDGYLGEHVCGTREESRVYDTFTSNNTTGLFVGHDHLNNASFLYDKDGIDSGNLGLKLTYGMSIDYLAYPGIYKKTSQRGGRMIEINRVENLALCDNIDELEYNQDDFDLDKQFGFYTYHIPYWQDLASKK